MPTYQYACTVCDERLEVVQKFTDDPLTVCSACGGKLRKLFSAVGIVFKGSGFYRTDSRNGSSSSNGKKAEPAAASGDSASKSDSAAKPAGSGSSKKTETASTGSPSPSSPSSSGAKVA